MTKIEIEFIEDLDKLRNLKKENGYIVTLTSDLDFSDVRSYKNPNNFETFLTNKWNTIGFKPIEIDGSNVIFDGCGYTIKNLYINNKKPECNLGLFNNYNGSIIIVKDLNINSAVVNGKNNIGIIGGVFNGSVNNCTVTGVIIGEENVGGLVGKSDTKLTATGNKTRILINGNENIGLIVGCAADVKLSKNMAELPYEDTGKYYVGTIRKLTKN